MYIRNMTREDIDFATECTQNEGWTTETADVFKSFLENDHDGCFIGITDEKRAGICVATNYGKHGFIGELIVKKEYRGRGFGKNFMLSALDYLKSSGCKSIQLDGDIKAVGMYEKLGFTKVCPSLRFKGNVVPMENEAITNIIEEDLDTIFSIDREVFGTDRSAYLKLVLGSYPTLCKKYQVGGKILGYIFARKANGIIAVGPMVLLDREIEIKEMLHALAVETGETPFRIGVLKTNIEVVDYFRKLEGMEEAGYSWRMLKGENSPLGVSKNAITIGAPAKG